MPTRLFPLPFVVQSVGDTGRHDPEDWRTVVIDAAALGVRSVRFIGVNRPSTPTGVSLSPSRCRSDCT